MKSAALVILIILVYSFASSGQDMRSLISQPCPKLENLCEEDMSCNVIEWDTKVEDETGRHYIAGELIYSDTNKILTPLDTIKQYYFKLVKREFGNDTISYPNIPTIPGSNEIDSIALISGSKYEKCICTENILLISSDLIIGIEGGVAEASAKANSKEGGGSWSKFLDKT